MCTFYKVDMLIIARTSTFLLYAYDLCRGHTSYVHCTLHGVRHGGHSLIRLRNYVNVQCFVIRLPLWWLAEQDERLNLLGEDIMHQYYVEQGTCARLRACVFVSVRLR